MKQCRPASSGLAAPALLLALMLAAAPIGSAVTTPSDKAALLDFKDAITSDDGLLTSWNATTDPCDDAWRGIECTCSQPNGAFTNCTTPSAGSPKRIIQIDFMLPDTNSAPQLTGTLPESLGGLTALRRLALAHQKLSGSLPDSFDGLTSLEQVELNDNALSGSLPDWGATLSAGQYVQLDDDQFSGPIPATWCSSPLAGNLTYNVTLRGNAELCDTVPACMNARIPTLTGTSLISANNSFGTTGALCNASSVSTCLPADGCGINIAKYTTNLTSLDFSFTPFPAGNATQGRNTSVNYFWGLGTIKGQDNVLTLNPVDTDANITAPIYLDGQNFTRFQYYVQLTLPGVAFINGQTYWPVVTASSQVDPTIISNVTGSGTLVDTDPPFLPPPGVVDNTEDYTIAQTQTDTDQMGASWDDWEDPQSGIAFYLYQILQASDPSGRGVATIFTPVSSQMNVGLNTSALATNLNLQVGERYIVRCTAYNNAGLHDFADSPALLIEGVGKGVSTSSAAIIAAACIGICSVIIAFVTVFVVRSRYNARRATRREQRRQMKELKSLMYGLVSSGGDPLQKRMDQIRNARQLCFVMTDLEASTAQASADPDAFLQVQDIHDTVMREGIAKHGGYEINTEGDAFQVAFTTVHQAVLFCLETQYRLLESVWPREVLKLPACKEVYAADGSLLYRGPRVRMGIHWAGEGTVAHRLHLLTKHRVFSGPGFLVTQEIGDAAHGGQVVCTHDAWLELRNCMDQAGFPTVEQLGLYKVTSWPSPVWLYQITHLLGKPLLRVFGEMRRIVQLEPGWGLNIVPPPISRFAQGPLTFCAMRVALDELGISMPGDNGEAPPLELPPLVSRKLYEIIAITAMQFRGYIFKVNEPQGRFMLAFSSTLDAVRCCHAAQAHILYTSWPAEAFAFSGATEHMPDGRLIFRGPRLATAVHETLEYSAEEMVQGDEEEAGYKAQHSPVEYSGPGEVFVRHIANATYGGQVVLTEPAWTTVQDHIPGQAQVISLGVHVVEAGDDAHRQLLMEVMPSVLARRTFPPPRTAAQLEPGFRDAPDPAHHLAILFMKASKPVEVTAAEQAAGSVADELVISTITEFNLAVAMISRAVRALLPAYDGYECKEPEAGKFTLAFRSLEAGVRWAAAMQSELLALPWPEAALEWGAAAEVSDSSGRPVWRGLRVRMGLAWGGATYRKPLNTGRADYFGNLPNLAARVSALAAPGQILLEGSGLGLDEVAVAGREDSVVLLPPPEGKLGGAAPDTPSGGSTRGLFHSTRPPLHGYSASDELPASAAAELSSRGGIVSTRTIEDGTVQLRCLGQFMLKGLRDPKVIWQALPTRLAASREFPLPPEHMAQRVPSMTMRRSGKPYGSVLSASSESFSMKLPIARSLVELVRLGKRGTPNLRAGSGSRDRDSVSRDRDSGSDAAPAPADRSSPLISRLDSNPSARSGRDAIQRSGSSGLQLERRSTSAPAVGTVERSPSWSEAQDQDVHSSGRSAARSARGSLEGQDARSRPSSRRNSTRPSFGRPTEHGRVVTSPFVEEARHRSAGGAHVLGASPAFANGSPPAASSPFASWQPQHSVGSADVLPRELSGGALPRAPPSSTANSAALDDYGSAASMPLFVRNSGGGGGSGTEAVSRSWGDLRGAHLLQGGSPPSGGFHRSSGSERSGRRFKPNPNSALGGSGGSGSASGGTSDPNLPACTIVGFGGNSMRPSDSRDGSVDAYSSPLETVASNAAEEASRDRGERFNSSTAGYAREVAELFLGRPPRATLDAGARRGSGSGSAHASHMESPLRSQASLTEESSGREDSDMHLDGTG